MADIHPFGNPANPPVEPEEKAPETEPTDAEVADAIEVGPEDQPTEEAHYRLGRWADLVKFECNVGRCPFDTLDEARAEEHWRVVHAPPPTPRPSTGLVALDGSPL